MNVALKEWDAQIQILESGQTTLLIRKGGIVEQRGEFTLEHTKFWFYPTFLHQNHGELRNEFHGLLRENPQVGKVELRSYAEVIATYKLEDLPTIRQLETSNALNADALERKYHYRNKPYVHALLLRVYTTQPTILLETPEYAGCVSWVNFEQNIMPINPQPALPETVFLEQQKKLEAIL